MKYQGYPIIRDDGKKAVIYLRVSTEEQVDNFSLDTQEEIREKIKKAVKTIHQAGAVYPGNCR